MGAGAEGAAGVDHDRERAGRRQLPGRAHPERADRDGAVKLPPALLPAVLDLGAPRIREDGEHACGRLSVGGELDRLGALALLESPPGA